MSAKKRRTSEEMFKEALLAMDFLDYWTTAKENGADEQKLNKEMDDFMDGFIATVEEDFETLKESINENVKGENK